MRYMIQNIIWYGSPSIGSGISRGDIRKRVKEVFKEISEDFYFEIDTQEVAKDHVHVFLSAPPKYSISKIVGILKSISASKIFQEFPEAKKELWGGEFWSDGYFARTVGDKVTTQVIRKYIKYHREETKRQGQLKLFE